MKASSIVATVAVLTAVALHNAALADEPSRLEGIWEGFLRPTSMIEVRLIFRVEATKEGLRGTALTPEFKSNTPVTLDTVSMEGEVAEFASKTKGWSFRGHLEPDARRIVGDWKQGPTSTPLALDKLDAPPAPSEVWEGNIELPGGAGLKLKVVFHLSRLAGGALRGTMDSPDQGSFGLRVNTVNREKGTLDLTVKAIGGTYSGQVDPDGASVVGQWKQGGMAMPLRLKKVDKATEVKRTQVPKPPFPYSVEEVAYDSKAPGVRIAGTLTVPPGPGPFPAVLLISGSGPQDRDESLLGHKPFLVLADDLTRRGIAVLRVDDRGTAHSTGNFALATSFDFADDAQAGFEYLKGRKEIAPSKVGLVGHSEGGLIAPMVAARTPEVGFIVLLAGPGLPGDEILLAQQALILKASGVPEPKVKAAAAGMARMIAVLKETPDPKAAEAKLKIVGAEVIATLPEAERKAMTESDPNGTAIARMTTPWFRTFILYDPRPTLARVRCPVLAVNGELDLQVPCQDNLRAISQALASGGNSRVTIRPLPGLNHLFQPSKTGAPSEYGGIEETFAPSALKGIADWIIEQTSPR